MRSLGGVPALQTDLYKSQPTNKEKPLPFKLLQKAVVYNECRAMS